MSYEAIIKQLQKDRERLDKQFKKLTEKYEALNLKLKLMGSHGGKLLNKFREKK